MCRLVLFAGTCTRCSESLTWADLSQRLSCLEAKNAEDRFGACGRGVFVETHAFDQECDACAGEDEGVAGMEFGLEEEIYQRRQEEQQYHTYAQYQLRMQPRSQRLREASEASSSSSSSPIAPQGPSKRGSARDEGDGRRKRART
ncbi:hypothetical protein CMUS01_04064 [Colletotrichum musicola]|uniref:Uncharacterized protein n=1 Tax=Colletotrichum musicola TaxID=2175873 RepID=A0A8H6U4N1_9PEZI|nr:hypothetical protein CMUS01_04064 [Colletotrichum musicola]